MNLKTQTLEQLIEQHIRLKHLAYDDFDHLNIIHGQKSLDEAKLYKDEILTRVDTSDYHILIELLSGGIISIKEMEELHVLSLEKKKIVDKNLAKLSEECGELTQIAMKSLLHGVESSNPKTGETNRKLLQVEMTDVIASIYHLASLINLELPEEMIENRKEKMIRLYGAK